MVLVLFKIMIEHQACWLCRMAQSAINGGRGNIPVMEAKVLVPHKNERTLIMSECMSQSFWNFQGICGLGSTDSTWEKRESTDAKNPQNPHNRSGI